VTTRRLGANASNALGPLVQSSAVGRAAPGWLNELTLPTEPPWLSMGTRARREPLLEPTEPGKDDVRRRKEILLTTVHDQVSVALPHSTPKLHQATAEAANLVARVTGRPLDDAWPPLEGAALLVPDDLVILLRLDGSWRMAAGVVCFPSHWSPSEKLGLPVAAIHGPVPRYAEELRHRVDRFLDRLSPDRPVWRRNWTIHASNELHAPRPVPTGGPVAPEDHWLRSERQVLAALPLSGSTLFTIRTDQVPLAVVKQRDGTASRLAGALRCTPPDLAAYRFGALDIGRLAAYLDRQG
jgi:dimethylamine monooxygenase subunit A